jgi:hypothetical protein
VAGRRFNGVFSRRPSPEGKERDTVDYFTLGHAHPLAQSSQHGHSQLQFGQSLQQSVEQHPPFEQVGAGFVAVAELPTKLAATSPAVTKSPPNSLTIIKNSLS